MQSKKALPRIDTFQVKEDVVSPEPVGDAEMAEILTSITTHYNTLD
jgi:hypothetical protein